MSIDINIANKGLLRLGVNAISSPDEESVRAETIRNIYNDCVDYLLSQYDFSFALKQIQLAKVDTTVLWGYKNAFKLPSDFIRLVGLRESTKYKLMGEYLLTDSDSCAITYIFKNYDPTTYSPLFKDLLSVRLAYELCPYIKDDRAFTLELYQQEIDRINNSANRESMQGDDEFLPEDNWVSIRRV